MRSKVQPARRMTTLAALGAVVLGLEQAESLEQLRVLWHGEKIHVSTATEEPGHGVDTQADHGGQCLTLDASAMTSILIEPENLVEHIHAGEVGRVAIKENVDHVCTETRVKARLKRDLIGHPVFTTGCHGRESG